jgi:hypothetical protein
MALAILAWFLLITPLVCSVLIVALYTNEIKESEYKY